MAVAEGRGLMGMLDGLDLQSLDRQPRRAVPKGVSRLDAKTEKAIDEKKAEAAWKKAVWKRDKKICRCCKANVLKTIELLPQRGEVHHVKGREDRSVRWDRRNGLLVCKRCHDRITGAVNDKLIVVGTKFFTVAGLPTRYINADKRVSFQKAA